MDVKLESLIEKIKKDGVEEAKKASGEIINKAKEEAETIINEAKARAEEIKKQAKAGANKLMSNAKGSLKQAARDLVLALRSELTILFERALKAESGAVMSPDFMKELIEKIINKWSAKEDKAWEVLAAKADKEKLEKLLLTAVKKQAKGIIEIKVSNAIDKGFCIGIKGEDFHYEFTDQSILEALREFLSPSFRPILDINNG